MAPTAVFYLTQPCSVKRATIHASDKIERAPLRYQSELKGLTCDISELLLAVFSQLGLLLDGECQPGILVVVGHDTHQLWEVPAVPFPHTHHEGVDVLVQGVEQRDGLTTSPRYDTIVKLESRVHSGAQLLKGKRGLDKDQKCPEQLFPAKAL